MKSSITVSRRGLVLGTAGLTGALAASGLTAPVAHAEPSDEPSKDPALEQTVEENEKFVKGEPALLDAGHVDLGPRLIDGEWIAAARDDSQAPPVWRLLEDIVFQVHDKGILTLPEDPVYGFTGAKPGEQVWAIPQVEIAGVVWLGWSTQDPNVVNANLRGMTLRFHSIQGPGLMSLFLQPGNFAPPQLLVDPKGEFPQDMFAEINTHVHANWVFTKPGVYLADLEFHAEDNKGKVYSASTTMRFSVGDQTSPDEAREATWADGKGPEARAAAAGGNAGGKSDGGGATGGSTGGNGEKGAKGNAQAEEKKEGAGTTALLVGGGIAAVAAIGGGAFALSQRKRNAAAEDAAWGENSSEGGNAEGSER